MVELLGSLPGVDTNALGGDGRAQLDRAIDAKLPRGAIKGFLSIPHIDVNAKGPSGRTALLSAVEPGNEDTVRHLLQHGADWNTGPLENMLLYAAIAKGYTSILRLLIRAGADPAKPTYGGAFKPRRSTLSLAVE